MSLSSLIFVCRHFSYSFFSLLSPSSFYLLSLFFSCLPLHQPCVYIQLVTTGRRWSCCVSHSSVSSFWTFFSREFASYIFLAYVSSCRPVGTSRLFLYSFIACYPSTILSLRCSPLSRFLFFFLFLEPERLFFLGRVLT